jgi:hypothetical protein
LFRLAATVGSSSGIFQSQEYIEHYHMIFYSVYQVVESSSTADIRPQEYVLLYPILEVGVCEGEYTPPE